jgi:DNA-directed RNA polymerase subunit beta'
MAAPRTEDFNQISLTVADPEQIRGWSHGEVVKPETINYRTQKPEMDGLFCERIFGPTKNYECYCGKYKRIRYKGIVCEKCGVEVTHSSVRRERMGHIDLAVPVAHIWYLRSTPSRLGLLLDLPIRLLEQVVYFASYIVISVDENAKDEAVEGLDAEFKKYKKQLAEEHQVQVSNLRVQVKSGSVKEEEVDKLESEFSLQIDELTANHQQAKKELENLRKNQILTELEYRELNMKFGHVFVAGTGAESIRRLLSEIDFEEFAAELEEEKVNTTGQKQKKILKRLRFVNSLRRANIRPEWMILTVLPVIPPDLRPMVQLDGGRFAASDLNDLYRRIINRNNRLKRLALIGAPEVIQRNEKRMLQEAIDTLINNSPRAGRAAFTSGDRRKLRSLSDMLKGKQGRFRQNLLGKRVDYSGRSVIVVGPQLKLNQCGLPKEMAMKLFKPFVIGELIRNEYVHNVKAAERYIQSGRKVVWDILEKVIKGRYVLLNRAPTLHRLGIQAFEPTLIEGKAIQIHPLVCAAFNADFDGDQMAVHVPLSDEAQAEAKNIIASARNLLKPSAGKPIITPTQDMVLGCYFLTQVHDGKQGEGMVFASEREAIMAEASGAVDLQAKIRCLMNGEIVETSVGRIIFNEVLPTEEIGYQNMVMNKKSIEKLIGHIFEEIDIETTAKVADAIKNLGFQYATRSGISIGQEDIIEPSEKEAILADADEKVRKISNQFWKGFITEHERYLNAIKIWAKAKGDITQAMIKNYEKMPENDVLYTIDSGARGNYGQLTQLAGMKGLVANPGGRTIELPIKNNLKQGFSILEYFIATHGGRKGKSDTALKTAEAGYLTRRLVDAVQDIIVREEDCGQEEAYKVTRADSEKIGEAFENRIFGRTLARDLVDSKTGEVLVERNTYIDYAVLDKIAAGKFDEVTVRSIMDCQTGGGICQRCYGFDLGNNMPVEVGTPAGIIAAQSIGEPGTQLTMRTFHMGGVAGGDDITQGLTRVEELFEVRSPKTPAMLSEIEGTAHVTYEGSRIKVTILADELGEDAYRLEPAAKVMVKADDEITANQIIAKGSKIIRATHAGQVKQVTEKEIVIKHTEHIEKVYELPKGTNLLVENKQKITVGMPLTSGHFDLHHYMELTDVQQVQRYLMNEVQGIYASQGQTINDKHIEIIVKQMLSKVRILHAGDVTDVLPGEQMEYETILARNAELEAEGKQPATFERLLLGLTRISLSTESWLSAASFQETIRVLVEASTTGKVDQLAGLKENVIIGKLIPAGHVYRKKFYQEQES